MTKQRRHKRTFHSRRYKQMLRKTIIVNPDILSVRQKVNIWKKYKKPQPIGNQKLIEYPTKKDISEPKYNYNIEIGIAVPSTTHKTEQISKEQFNKRINETITFLNNLFEGSSANIGYGTYYSNQEKINIGENVVFVKIWTTKMEYAKWDLALRKWIKIKVKEWDQESVQFTYSDGRIKNSFLIFK